MVDITYTTYCSVCGCRFEESTPVIAKGLAEECERLGRPRHIYEKGELVGYRAFYWVITGTKWRKFAGFGHSPRHLCYYSLKLVAVGHPRAFKKPEELLGNLKKSVYEENLRIPSERGLKDLDILWDPDYRP